MNASFIAAVSGPACWDHGKLLTSQVPIALQVLFLYTAVVLPQPLYLSAQSDISNTSTGRPFTVRHLQQTAGNRPDTAAVFTVSFAAKPALDDAAVQIAVQNAAALANSPLTVSISALAVGLGSYNVTAMFPIDSQVLSTLHPMGLHFGSALTAAASLHEAVVQSVLTCVLNTC